MRLRLRMPTGVKRVTNPVLGRIPIRIASGVNRGLWWSLASAGSGYGTGTRERAQLSALAHLLQPGDVFWDVGAHCGYITLFAAKHVGPSGHIHSFEPGESSRWFLHKHVHWNGLANVTIHPYALGAHDGYCVFGGGATSKQHRLGSGTTVVPVRRLDTLIASGECNSPEFIKIDVEGAELDILINGIHALPPTVRLLVAVHSEEIYRDCIELLRSVAYRVYESARLRRYHGGTWHGDADLVAFGPGYSLVERDLETLKGLAY